MDSTLAPLPAKTRDILHAGGVWNKIRFILRAIGIAALFITALIPLVVWPTLVFPFISTKVLTFRICVIVAVTMGIAVSIHECRFRPVPIFWSWVALLAVMAVSDYRGWNPQMSFVGGIERMGGWAELLSMTLFFASLVMLFRTRRIWRAYLWTALAVSTPIAAIAFFQKTAAWSPLLRPGSTLGNSSYLGTYAMTMVFVSLWLAKGLGRRATAMAYGLAALNLTILYLTETRSAVLGLFAGLLTMVWSTPATRRLAYWLAGLLVAGGLILLAARHDFSTASLAYRMTHMGSNGETTNIRLQVWKMALRGILRHPFLGWGQEGMIPLNQEYHTAALLAFAPNPWDRAHNLILDWLVVGGTVGLAAYAALIGLGIRAARGLLEGRALVGFFVAYIVNGMFIFDTPVSYLMLTVMLALVSTPECSGSFQSCPKR